MPILLELANWPTPNNRPRQKLLAISTKIEWHLNISFKPINKGKLHFTTLNYASDYILHLKLFECILCTLNYHTLHPSVTFAVIFNRILLHMTSTCILLRWNKLKRLKHYFSKSIKIKADFFPHLPPWLMCMPTSSPNSNSCKP